MKLLAPIINDDDIVNKKYVDTATNKLQSQIDDKADKRHNHDDRYYTESEVDSKVSAINNTISSHISNTSNPHSVTKSQVGLSNVENKSSATIRGELTKSNVTTALGYTPYTPNEVDNKFAALETNIDWKEAVSTFSDIATTYPNPEDGWTVNVKDTDYTYRYNGTAWVAISANAIPKATDTVDGLLSKEDHAKYEDANNKKHTHSNKSVLDGITSALVNNWNAAKTHADSAHAPSNAEVNQNAFSQFTVGTTSIIATNKTDVLTLVAGDNITLTPDISNKRITIVSKNTIYTHPTYTERSSGLYKITVDGTGHVSGATAVTKSDITALGIPSSDTDTKVTSTTTNPSSSTTYYPTWVTGATTGGVLINDGIRYSTLQGTTSAEGYSILSLGNNTASGTAENKYGAIRLYSTGSYYGQIVQIPGGSDNAKHALPTASGTILNTGTTSFTPSLTSGTAIGTLKINNKSTTLYAPDNTDTKVNVTLGTTTKAYLLGTSTTPTSTAKGVTAIADTGVYLDTTAGHLTAIQFNGNHTYDGGNTAWSYKNIKSSFEKGTIPTDYTQYWALNFMDKNGGDIHENRVGYLTSYVAKTTGTTITEIVAMKNEKDSSDSASIAIGKRTNGTEYLKLGSSTIGGIDRPVYINAGQVTPCNLLPFIVGTQTAATSTWTGDAPTISALSDGLTIRYWLPYAGSGNATLNLTLADGTNTGNIDCYYGGTARLTTHYGAGNIITLTYRENVTIAGSEDTYTGWWADANYNVSNTAGSTNTASKIFLIGATSQTTATKTYSRNNIYANSDNCLYLDNNSKVNSYFTSKQTYTDSNNKNINHQIGFGISASGNRGIYDNELKNWLIYANTSNKVTVNGDIVTGAIKCVSGTLGTSAATLDYQSGRTKVLLLASAPSSAYCDFVLLSISNSMTAISSTILVNMGAASIKYSVSSGGAITLTPVGSGAPGSKYMALYFTE